MKPLPSILTGALIASLIYNIFQYKISRETETELTHQLDSVKTYAKDMEVQQEILSDKLFEQSETISMQADIIQNRELETIREHERAIKYKKKYENVIFRAFANDSLRLRELSRHFPSLGNH